MNTQILPIIDATDGAADILAITPNMLSESIRPNKPDRRLLEDLNKNWADYLPPYGRITEEQWEQIDAEGRAISRFPVSVIETLSRILSRRICPSPRSTHHVTKLYTSTPLRRSLRSVHNMDSSDLRNQLDQTKGSTSTEETGDQPDDAESEPPVTETAAVDESKTTDDDGIDEERETSDEEDIDDQEDGGPAFTTQESDKMSIYPHEDNSHVLKVLCNSIESDLLALGHNDFEVREAHDAMVRLANEHPREVTQLVLEARGLDPDAVDDLS